MCELLCAGSWSPSDNSQNEWIQVEFESLHRLRSVPVLGRPDASLDQYVKTYNLTHSLDGNNFVQPKTNRGSDGPNSKVTTDLKPTRLGRYFRLTPITWNNQIALRFDFEGCESKLL